MSEDGQIRTFYRVTRSDPPTYRDSTSFAMLGRPLANPTPERLRRWQGLSVFTTIEQAREKARHAPLMGSFIARLEIRPDESIRVERTTSSAGHFTIWGTPDDIIACWIPPVVPVRE